MQSSRVLLLAQIAFIFFVVPLGAQTYDVNLTGGNISFGPGSPYGVDAASLLTAPGYTITNVAGEEPSNTGIGTLCNDTFGGCTPAQIASALQTNFGIIAFPPFATMVVNGQLVGMFGFPGFIATSFYSSLGNDMTLTVWGNASGYGSFNECDPFHSPGMCVQLPNSVDFLFGTTQWQYFGQFVPDTSLVASGGTYDVQSMSISTVPYRAFVQPPINANGSSIFNANRGVIPLKFTLTQNNVATCSLPAATIIVTRIAGGVIGPVDESTYSRAADNGSNFRIDSCQYVYNLAASALGVGTYRVDISIAGVNFGHAVFALK
jgi:hypothetical protein